MTILAVTGHRPPKCGGYDDKTRSLLIQCARGMLVELQPDEVITGMALGWDQAVAFACYQQGIPYTAAVPFHGFQALWPKDSQDWYERLLTKAKHIEIVTDAPAESYQSRWLQKRNEWMVDRADRIGALFDGHAGGGTFNCINYARTQGKPVTNFWKQFQALKA